MEHSILCPAYVSPIDKSLGAEPSGACDCGVGDSSPSVATDEVKVETAQPEATACGDTHPETEEVAPGVVQNELPFDPEPLPTSKDKATSTADTTAPPTQSEDPVVLATPSASRIDPEAALQAARVLNSYTQATPPATSPAEPATSPASQPGSSDVATTSQADEKPKRKRKTKAEKEAEDAAAKAAGAATAPEPPKEVKTEASIPNGQLVPENVPPITVAEAFAELKEIALASGQIPRLEVSEKLLWLAKRVERSGINTQLTSQVNDSFLKALQVFGSIHAAAPPASPTTSDVAATSQSVAPTQPTTPQAAPPASRDVAATSQASPLPAAVPIPITDSIQAVERKQSIDSTGIGSEPPPTSQPKTLRVVGIDSGYSGYSTLYENGKPVRFWPAPAVFADKKGSYDESVMLAQCREWKALGVDLVMLETLAARPPRMGGGKTNYARGYAMGAWRVALAATGLPRREATPETWKSALGLPSADSDTVKKKAAELARGLHPDVDFREIERDALATKTCFDKCESTLIARYGWMLLSGLTAELDANLGVAKKNKAAKAAWTRSRNEKIDAWVAKGNAEPETAEEVLKILEEDVPPKEIKRLLEGRKERAAKAAKVAAREAKKAEKAAAKTKKDAPPTPVPPPTEDDEGEAKDASDAEKRKALAELTARIQKSKTAKESPPPGKLKKDGTPAKKPGPKPKPK